MFRSQESAGNILKARYLFVLTVLGIAPFFIWPLPKYTTVWVSLYESSVKGQKLLHINKSFNKQPVKYAVFSSNTPNGESYRSYDYAYNLPLTALAWARIGFMSIVLIIGSRCEWENDPTLMHILTHLDAIHAKTIFIDSPLEHRTTISQTARLFAVNMLRCLINEDYLITSDSDLWPLRKENYLRDNTTDIVLVNADCCGTFIMNSVIYPMYPMSNIGATVSTWRQIMNVNNQIIANDSKSILQYIENVFGGKARKPVVVGEEPWYRDQQLISIRLAEWIAEHGNSAVRRVSFNHGANRVDRSEWDADTLVYENFSKQFDAHLPVKSFLLVQQKRVQPLINLMYGKDSWEAVWCINYTVTFLAKINNYLKFNDIN